MLNIFSCAYWPLIYLLINVYQVLQTFFNWVVLYSVVFLYIYIYLGGPPKSLQMVTAAMKLKDTYSLEEKL